MEGANSNTVYGFNKADADAVVRLVGLRDHEYVEGRVRSTKGASGGLAYTTSSIAARSGSAMGSGTATLYTTNGSGTWSSGATGETLYNLASAAVPTDTWVVWLQIPGGEKVVIVEDCG